MRAGHSDLSLLTCITNEQMEQVDFDLVLLGVRRPVFQQPGHSSGHQQLPV
jgi:hypothetical protein